MRGFYPPEFFIVFRFLTPDTWPGWVRVSWTFFSPLSPSRCPPHLSWQHRSNWTTVRDLSFQHFVLCQVSILSVSSVSSQTGARGSRGLGASCLRQESDWTVCWQISWSVSRRLSPLVTLTMRCSAPPGYRTPHVSSTSCCSADYPGLTLAAAIWTGQSQ